MGLTQCNTTEKVRGRDYIIYVDIKMMCKAHYAYLYLKSGYSIRFGKPFLQIRIPSSTPLQVS